MEHAPRVLTDIDTRPELSQPLNPAQDVHKQQKAIRVITNSDTRPGWSQAMNEGR